MAGHRILIVDDQRDTSRVLRSALETLKNEFEIDDVLSGEEALLEFARGEIDLLVADVLLPGISGLELIDKFKLQNPEAKVILISGVADPIVRRQVAQAGADAFFFKPLEIADFLDAVERALGLVETLLPNELQAEAEALSEAEQQAAGLAECIARLRQTLEAEAVCLMGDSGRLLVSAGDLPDPAIESELMPALMAALSSGVRVANFLKADPPHNLLSFHGGNYSLHLAHVGEAYGLLIALDRTEAVEIGTLAEATQESIKVIVATLSSLGVSLRSRQPAAEGEPSEAPPVDALSDPELEALLKKAGGKKLKKEEVDAFWAALSEKGAGGGVVGGDALSYDQARQLGLAPSDDSS